MVPLLADENFNHRILRGLRLRLPSIDCLLAQETQIYQREDPEVLDWAAFVIPKELPIGTAIEELATLLYCSFPEEFPCRVIHLPI
jgi:hypothetical protein